MIRGLTSASRRLSGILMIALAGLLPACQAEGPVIQHASKAVTAGTGTHLISRFEGGPDGWQLGAMTPSVLLAARTGPATPGYIDDGGNPGGYISMGLRSEGAMPGERYFLAPPSFYGNQGWAYGRKLRFDLLRTSRSLTEDPDVLLSDGRRSLTFTLPDHHGRNWQHVSIPLHGAAGWRLLDSGAEASDSDLLEILSNLRDLRIKGVIPVYGVHTSALDNVTLGSQ